MVEGLMPSVGVVGSLTLVVMMEASASMGVAETLVLLVRTLATQSTSGQGPGPWQRWCERGRRQLSYP